MITCPCILIDNVSLFELSLTIYSSSDLSILSGGVATPGRKKPRQRQFPGGSPGGGGGGGFAQQSMLQNARQEIEQLDEIVDQLRLEIQVCRSTEARNTG